MMQIMYHSARLWKGNYKFKYNILQCEDSEDYKSVPQNTVDIKKYLFCTTKYRLICSNVVKRDKIYIILKINTT